MQKRDFFSFLYVRPKKILLSCENCDILNIQTKGGAQPHECIPKIYNCHSGLSTKMWNWLNETLLKFRPCFSRNASFEWFINVVIGLMVRSDHLGVTSIVRELGIDPDLYENMIHFFHASSWQLCDITSVWLNVVKNSEALYLFNGKPVIVIDGVKVSKEARKMPGVKKQHQDSEDSSKAQYMFGHLCGATGLLIGNESKLFCTLIKSVIQDGVHTIRAWQDSSYKKESHVVTMIQDAWDVAFNLKQESIALADRYFLSRPALEKLAACEKETDKKLMSIVTRAKSNAVAYEMPIQKSGRGAPRKKGDKVRLIEFCKDLSIFTDSTIISNGEIKPIKYYCKDLLWGEGLYQKLRFVVVQFGNIKSIFVSTDLLLSPEDILKLYGFRFKIETTFRTLKQVTAGFSYHFWSSSMPKLNKYLKKDETNPIDNITEEKDKNKILSALNAIEGFISFSLIALGLLQMCSIRFSEHIDFTVFRWLRTKSNKTVSEATVASFIQKIILLAFKNLPSLRIGQIIKNKQLDTMNFYDPSIIVEQCVNSS